MGFSGELLDAETLDDSGKSATLSDTDDVDGLKSREDLVYSNFLLEEGVSEVDFLSNRTSVDLDFEDVGFLLLEVEKTGLSVSNNSDDSAVLFKSVQKSLNGFRVAGDFFFVFFEAFPLGSVPVFIESTLEVGAEGLGPNGGKTSEAADGFNVADNADDSDGWGLDDGDCLDDLLFVELRSSTFDFTKNVSHSRLEAGESSKMGLFRGVVFGEGPYAASMVASSSLGKES